MVDNRAAGFYGIGGSFNFKSGDPSGTAAKMSQEKYGSEAMYLPPAEGEDDGENLYNQPYVDRSALLKATLKSLAMTNVASVINAKRHKKSIKDIIDENEEEDEESQKNKKSHSAISEGKKNTQENESNNLSE